MTFTSLKPSLTQSGHDDLNLLKFFMSIDMYSKCSEEDCFYLFKWQLERVFLQTVKVTQHTAYENI